VKSKRDLLGSWEYTEYMCMHKSIYPVYPVEIRDLELGFHISTHMRKRM
jgi:hypothetical protein